MILSHWSHLYINRTCLGSSNYGCDRCLQYQMSHYEIIPYWPKFEVLHLGTKRLDCWFICLSYSNSWWFGILGKNMDKLTFILHLFYHKRGNLCPCAKFTTFVLCFCWYFTTCSCVLHHGIGADDWQPVPPLEE